MLLIKDAENKSDVLLVVSKENYRKCQVTYRLRLQTVLHFEKIHPCISFFENDHRFRLFDIVVQESI